jgi:hypothetical protein
MTEAQNAYALDLSVHGRASAFDIQNLSDTTAAYKRLQGALDVATGFALTREQKLEAAQDKREKTAASLETRRDKAETKLIAKRDALADAAEKAYRSLLHVRLSVR